MRKGLTIRIKARGEHLTVGALVDALERALDSLKALAAKMPGAQELSDWEVLQLHANGELMMTVQGDNTEELAPAYIRGLRTLETSTNAPTGFDEDDLTNARRLVALLDKDVESIVISAPGEEPVSPTQHVAANVDAILKKRYHYAEGEIHGRLDRLDVHGKNTFTIFDPLTDEKTVCEFPEELYAKAYAAVRKRVAVYGRIKFNRDGQAIAMNVHELRELRDATNLSQVRAGEEVDITGGMDSAEYIRGMRDAE